MRRETNRSRDRTRERGTQKSEREQRERELQRHGRTKEQPSPLHSVSLHTFTAFLWVKTRITCSYNEVCIFFVLLPANVLRGEREKESERERWVREIARERDRERGGGEEGDARRSKREQRVRERGKARQTDKQR